LIAFLGKLGSSRLAEEMGTRAETGQSLTERLSLPWT
jgi:hypothetical protein